MRALLPTLTLLFLAAVPTAAATAAPLPTREAPRILSLRTLETPLAGVPVRIEIKIKDPLAAINGIQADFGDGRDRLAESACRPGTFTSGPFRPGGTATFVLTHLYRQAGDFTIAVVGSSGECGVGPLWSKRALRVRVRPAKPVLGKTPVLASAASDCAAANDLPDLATAWRTLLCLSNAARAERSLPALKSNRRLRKAAAAHARDMVTRGYFAHESPSGRGLADRLRRHRYRGRAAAENIGAGTDALATPLAMLIAWMESAPHRANLLDRTYDEAGIGIAAGYPAGGEGATYTLDLGRR